MSIENPISAKFSDLELRRLSEGLAAIEEVISGKTIDLTIDQREQYISVANQNNCIIDKAKNYMEQHPGWMPAFFDKEEFNRDYKTRQQIEGHIQMLKNLTKQLTDVKTLLDYDSYANALSFYRMIRYLAGKKEPGVKSVYEEMKLLFKEEE